MNAVTMPRVPRRTVEPATAAEPAERTPDVIRAEIEALRQERDRAVDRLDELDGSYDAAVLKGDDVAERHEAEITRTRRVIRRAELQLPPLEVALADAAKREADERRSAQQADATAAVEAVLSAVGEYESGARAVTAFLAQWAEADAAARAAGVPTPDQRCRVVPGKSEPQRTESYSVFRSPEGTEYDERPRPSTMVQDPKTGLMVAGSANEASRIAAFREERRTRTIPARRDPDIAMPPLASLVRLPGVRAGDPSFWPASAE